MSDKQGADKSRRDRSIETARALGADENEAVFKEKLAVIAAEAKGRCACEFAPFS